MFRKIFGLRGENKG
jgi:hypothetical protein